MATPPHLPKPDLASLRIHEGQRGDRKIGKYLGFTVLFLVIIAAISAAAFALRNQKPQVEIATVQGPSTGSAGVLNASGYVTPRRRATIAAKITGRITGVFFDEGTVLREGQLLAKLDDSDSRRILETVKADRDSAQAAITDYQVQLRNAEVTLRRNEALQKAGVQTQEALDNAATSVDSLKAKINLAKQQVNASEARIREAQQAVDNCTIRAPFAGIAVSKDAQVGEIISPVSAGGGFTRTGIATVVDMKSLEIEVDVNESYIARVTPHMHVEAVLDAYPDVKFDGIVRTVIPTADRQKATVKVRISFAKLDPRVLPDMGVKVTFLEDQPAKKSNATSATALAPSSALHDDHGTKIVFLLKDDHLERRAVSIGATRGSDTEILAGLLAGDSVVVKGPDNLHDGQVVEIKK
ncbi:MAG: efflux RND transporter periplasmic adaptor subunit [Candidatus Acidiferrum sp.]